MELTERQLTDLKALYESLDSKRHTKYLSEYLKADSRIEGMILVLRVLGISLDDFEQILGKN